MDDTRHDERKTWRPRTNLVRGGTWRSEFGETCEAIYLTSGFVYDSAEQAKASFAGKDDHFIYSRYSNPSVSMFEERMKLLEGTSFCQGTGSGMGAVFASLACQLKAGDRLVASRALFGSCDYVCTVLMPQYGVTTVMVDGTDLAQWEKALSEPTAMVFMETPSNPMMEIIDLEAVCKMAHKAGARVVVDNVFATPCGQRPMEFGADIVVYSSTKHIDGQGRSLGGAILFNDQEYWDKHLRMFIRHTGPTLSAFNAWLQLKGLETLELRVKQHCDNAMAVATFLEGHKGIGRVVFPGLASHPQKVLVDKQMTGPGSVISFEVMGDEARVFRFMNALKLVDISNNLGDTKSLVTHPATTTHQRVGPEGRARLGISDQLVRLSVGLEDVDDIKEDIEQALAA